MQRKIGQIPRKAAPAERIEGLTPKEGAFITVQRR
jgi:hypothetical protein